MIEPATAADLDAIDEIEAHSFKSNNRTFKDELSREWARIDVVRDGQRIIAFCNYWLVTTELHILSIATHPDYRGKGIATKLLAHVLDKARQTGCSLATLEVRRGNQPAIALYERAGFKTVHVRARYYQDDEDALVMLKAITESNRRT